MEGIVTMSKEQRQTYQLAMEVIRNKLTVKEFSLLVDMSYRQARRIVKAVRKKDAFGVIHGNQGRTRHNKTSREREEELESLLRTKYYDFNLTHFQEVILEREGLRAGKNVIHRIARKHGLVKRPKRRPRQIHKPRVRLPSEGMLIQFDGSEHNWFSNFVCDLIVGIDDATSKIVGGEFFIGETSLHCLKVMKDITAAHGIPDAYYLDEAGYFGKKDRDQDRTHIGRALETLDTRVIIAGSAQAKGRVERLFGTLQDRLIAELRLNNIKTIPQANLFLKQTFIPDFNKRFSVKARDSKSRYRAVHPTLNLENIFCRKDQRKISGSHSFSWGGKTYVIATAEPMDFRFRTININTHLDGSVDFDIRGLPVVAEIYEPQRKNAYYPKAVNS
jgi:transposase